MGPDTTILSYKEIQTLMDKFETPEKYILDHIRKNAIYFFNNIHTTEHAQISFEKMCNVNYENILLKRDWSKNLYSQETRRGIIVKKSKFDLASSNAFFEPARLKTSLRDRPSPEEAYYSDTELEEVLGKICIDLPKNQPLTPRVIRNEIFKNSPAMEQFNPLTAKYIIDQYSCGGNVLDFYSAWGDKLSGFLASNAEHYTGVCDNNNLLDSYIDEIDFLSEVSGHDKDVSVTFDNCEDLDFTSKEYDLIFTSPPRFALHKGDQKSISYPQLSEWKKRFLKSTIESAWDALKVGGHMVIHLDDYRKNKNRIQLVSYLLGAIGSDLGARRLTPVGYQLSRHGKNYIEPLWIWRKEVTAR